jgi:hypothetical protein
MKIISRKTISRIFVLFVILGIALVVLHFYWQLSVENYQKQLQARGEKLQVAELMPPTVAPPDNSASNFLQAAALLSTNSGILQTNPPPAMRMVTPGKAMVGWAQPAVCDETERSTNTWNEIGSALADDAQAIQLFLQITNRPVFDFGLAYDLGTDISNTHLVPLKKAAQRLSAEALSDLHREDVISASADLHALLTLIRATQDERLMISQWVRVTLAQMAMMVTWEYLQAPQITEDQLALIQRDWMQLEFRDAAENALLMERAMGEKVIENCRQTNLKDRLPFVEGETEDWLGQTKVRSKEIAWRYWWSYWDQLRALKGYQVLIESTRFVETNYVFRTAIFDEHSKLAELGINTLTNRDWWALGFLDNNLRTMFSQGVEVLSVSLKEVEKAELAKQMAVTALALKRYDLRHGNYPPELATLVPEFLPAVPRDPIDGKPLRYQRIGKAFLLYSIGDDGVDNGGDPVPLPPSDELDWMKGRDYVWPAPATDQEIQAYERRLSFRPH